MGLEYQDTAQQLTAAAQQAEEEAGPPEEWTEAQLPPLPDITADAVRAALAQLQQLLHVEAGKAAGSSSSAAEATPEGLQKAHAMLETCVLPALAELAKQRQPGSGGAVQQPAAAAQGPERPAAAASQHAAVAAMLSQYPLGFSTGEAGADLGATILRMLYIKDLRALQVGFALPLACCAAACVCIALLPRPAPPRCWPVPPAAAARQLACAAATLCWPCCCCCLCRLPAPLSSRCSLLPLLPCPTADAGGLGHRASAGVHSQPTHRCQPGQGWLLRQPRGRGVQLSHRPAGGWSALRPGRQRPRQRQRRLGQLLAPLISKKCKAAEEAVQSVASRLSSAGAPGTRSHCVAPAVSNAHALLRIEGLAGYNPSCAQEWQGSQGFLSVCMEGQQSRPSGNEQMGGIMKRMGGSQR